MCASLSGVSRDMGQGVETCLPVSWECDPSATAMGGAVVPLHTHRRQHGWTCPQLSTFFCSTDQGVKTRVYNFFTGMLGSVLDGQPTVILQVSFRKRRKKEEEKRENNKIAHL